ncbi:MAG: glycosyltransferase [Piscinibacter sp.]|nr:glycosyltransferase [Piscinibacter sp.]
MKVLYLSHRLPYAPNRGDRIRSFHLLEGLRAAADVHVVSLVHDDDEASHTGELAARGMTVTTARVGGPWRWVRAVAGLAGTTPVTHALLDAPELAPAIAAAIARVRPDVVVALGSGMAKYAMRPPLDAFPYVLDMVDVDSEKWRALVKVTPPPKSWIYRREARVLAAFEAVATSRAVTTLVVNDRECASLKALAPAADIRVLRMGIDLDDFAPVAAPPPSATVVFCGVMNYAPNEAGAVWLARAVWPLVIARRPDARLQLVGSQPSAAVRALAGPDIEVTGRVPHTRDYMWKAAVAAAPLHTARGLQNKVLEALAAGLPVVTTTAVREGLPDSLAPGCDVADDAPGFAERLLTRLAMTPEARRARAAEVDLGPHSWRDPRREFAEVVRAAAASARPR